MSTSPTSEPKSDFVCDCDDRMRSVCAEEPFYKEHQGKRYCVLHYPGSEKIAEFHEAYFRKFAKRDFNFRGVWFPDDIDFYEFTFNEGVDFRSATFCGKVDFLHARFNLHADFGQTTFADKASFSDAIFIAGANFGKATFSALADFNKTRFTADAYFLVYEGAEANFSDAEFLAAAVFSHATFSAVAYFYRATFSQEAYFNNITFTAVPDFRGATFSEQAHFSQSNFNAPTYFGSAKFGSRSYFQDATFTRKASFGLATFNGEANFQKVSFKDADFYGAKLRAPSDFFHATFDDETDFSTCTFGNEVNFREATFSGPTKFGKSTFTHKTDFRGATFRAPADFSSATFIEQADFSLAVVLARMIFREVTFGDRIKFAGTKNRQALTETSSFDFQFVRIQKPEYLSFHSVSLRPFWFVNVDPRRFDFTNVDWDWRAVDREIGDLKANEVSWPHNMLFIACRRLADNAEESHRYEEASKFRYMAMEARRLESWRGFAPWRLSWWYWLASGYGERVWQAFFVLLGILLLSALLYTRVGFARWEPKFASESDIVVAKRDDVGAPLKFSRALTYSAAVMTFQRPEPKPATTTAQSVVLLETILGPVQAALLALAIRRKFMR